MYPQLLNDDTFLMVLRIIIFRFIQIGVLLLEYADLHIVILLFYSIHYEISKSHKRALLEREKKCYKNDAELFS